MIQRSSPSLVLLDRRLSRAASDLLGAQLWAAGVGTTRSGAVNAVAAPLEALDLSANRKVTVALFDGQLGAEHAKLVMAGQSLLLLACREEEGLPSLWEVQLVARMLGEGPLLSGRLAPVKKLRLGAVQDLAKASKVAEEVALSAGASRSAARVAADAMHELAANALLDAPANESGVPRYAHKRSAEIKIAPADACSVALSLAGGRLLMSATDHFGRLTPAPIARALSEMGSQAKLRTAGGGAGLGLRRLLGHGDCFAAKISPGRLCEVVCAVDLSSSRRRPTSPKSLLILMGAGD